jgi:hypothetical protein
MTKSTPTAIPMAKDDAITILVVFIGIPRFFDMNVTGIGSKAPRREADAIQLTGNCTLPSSIHAHQRV